MGIPRIFSNMTEEQKARHWLGFETTLKYKQKVQDHIAKSEGRWGSVAHLIKESLERQMEYDVEKAKQISQ